MRGRRGLTIIEMLVVLGVLVALVSLALPAFGGWLDSARIDSAVAQIGGAVQMGRQIARDSGKPAALIAADSAAGAFLTIETGKGEGGRIVGQLPKEFAVRDDVRASFESKSSEPKPARLALCLPDGTVDAGSAVISVRGREYTLSLSRWTGSVTATERVTKDDGDKAPEEKPPTPAGETGSTGGAR